MEKYKFSFTTGKLNQWEAKNKIQEFCFHRDIVFTFTQNKSLLEVTFLCEFRGSKESIKELQIFLDGLSHPFNKVFNDSKEMAIIENYLKVLKSPSPFSEHIIYLSGCRSLSTLKDSIEYIKHAIKQRLVDTTDRAKRQLLVDIYVRLAGFIDEELFMKFYSLWSKKNKTVEDETREKVLMGKILSLIDDTSDVLSNEINVFQIEQGNT